MNYKWYSIPILFIAAMLGVVIGFAQEGTESDLQVNMSKVDAIGTGFTYQGYLEDNGSPANGNFDFESRIYNAAAVGTVLATDTDLDVTVTNGLFTIVITAGSGVFTGGSRWLSVGVRPAGGGDYTTIGPRQELHPVPQAIYASHAGNLLDPGETVVHVSPFDMIQSDGLNSVSFAARGSGRLQIQTNNRSNSTIGGVFVYIPVDVPSQVLGKRLKLRRLDFCYNGELNPELGVLAGIQRATVRQVDAFERTSLRAGNFESSVLAENDDCHFIDTDTQVEVTGSIWVRFKIITGPIPLEFTEISLRFTSD